MEKEIDFYEEEDYEDVMETFKEFDEGGGIGKSWEDLQDDEKETFKKFLIISKDN